MQRTHRLVTSLVFVALSAGLAISSLACEGCSSTPNPTPIIQEGVDLACNEVLGIADKDGISAATVCTEFVKLVTPFVAQAIDELEKAGTKKAAADLTFVPLTKNGKAIGKVRTDVAKFVQAKVDAS